MEMKRLRAHLHLPEPGVRNDHCCNYSVLFDGSTWCGEAIVVILRFINDQWEIVQRLVRIDIVAKSVTAEQLAQDCLFTDLQLRGHQILATMRDGAAINGAAMRITQPFMPAMIDVVCLSHTLDNVGNHFYTPVLMHLPSTGYGFFLAAAKQS